MKLSSPLTRTFGALTAALALTVLAGTAPALAHDALASSNPADGATITTNPGTVSITLTKAPDTGVPGSNIIKVTAPDGHVVSEDETTLQDATLSVAADIDHAGKHTVEWRAVSADGHPIEGTFSFTYAPAGGEASASSPGAASATPTQTRAAETPAPAASQSTQDNTALFIGIGAVLLVLVAVGAYLIGRRAKAGTSTQE